MSGRMKLVMLCNSFVAAVCGLLGIVYLARREVTYYHKEVIGVEWETLAPGVQTMLLVLMKGTGVAVLVTGLTIAILTWIPVRQGQKWSRWATLGVGLACLIPMLLGASYLAVTTGAPSPWWLNAVLIASLFGGFFLSSSSDQRNKYAT